MKQSVFGDELKWDYVQERGHSKDFNVSRLLFEVVRFVQRKHFVLGLVWGVRFALISSFCNLLADFFLGQVEVVDTLDLPEDEGYEGDGDDEHVEQVEPAPTESVFVQDEPVGDDLQD